MPQPASSLTIEPATLERVQRLALAQSVTPQRILAEAVEQYAERAERRAQLRQDVQYAWDDYQSTGLHATAAEVDAWLDRLEFGEDAAPPACHV